MFLWIAKRGLLFQFGPGAFCAINFVLFLFGLLSGWNVVLSFNGFVWAWVYLRFHQRHESGAKGDASDAFAFDQFFPAALQ